MKRMLRSFLAVLCTLALLCACGAPAAGSSSAAASAPAAASASAQGTGIVRILYTNDVHCAISDAIGYAGLASIRRAYEADGDDVLLVDCGDAVQGNAYGTLSQGEYPIELMNDVGYDLAIPGNHEFDYGTDRFLELTKKADFPYLSCNFTDLTTNSLVLDAYRIETLGGRKVAFVGVTTPRTITSSTPAYFQDENGAWRYGFCQDDTGAALYAAVQKAVDAARAEGAATVVLMGHLGIEEACSPWTSSEVIANTTGIDVVLDGHSHTVMAGEQVKNKDGKPVLLTQTGTGLANVGVLTIAPDGALSAKLLAYADDVAKDVSDIEDEFEETLSEPVAKTDAGLYINDPTAKTADGGPVRLVRNAETNLGDLCADAYRDATGADVAFVNGGGVRADVAAGTITYGDVLKVHPFGNAICVAEVTGQQLLDALEMSVKDTPSEFGGFVQVSGLTFTFRTDIPSPVELDADGMFVQVGTGARRVQSAAVGGAPLDPAKTYKLAATDYQLKDSGDGYTMFKDAPILQDGVMLDSEALIRYLSVTLGGEVGSAYADPYGDGRITAAA